MALCKMPPSINCTRDGDGAPLTSDSAGNPLRSPGSRIRRVPSCGIALVAVMMGAIVMLSGVDSSVAAPHRHLSGLTANDKHLPHAFATKTMYWDQRHGVQSDQHYKSSATYPAATDQEDDMRLLQTQLIVRHGIRYPTQGGVEEIQDFLEKLAPFDTALPTWLRNYTLPYNASVAGELSSTGYQGIQEYARRQLHGSGDQLSPVAKPVFAADRYFLAHTHANRAKASAVAFAQEYFENPDDVVYVEYAKNQDPLLRFFDSCPRFLHEVKNNASAIAEKTAFETTEIMIANRQRLSQRLGLDIELVTASDVSSVVTSCAFDLALYNDALHWCSLLDSDMILSMDYYADLKKFYQCGGGYRVNYEMAAVLLQDIMAAIEKHIQTEDVDLKLSPPPMTGRFFFAHAETTLPLMTLLGFGDRTPLSASWTMDSITSRGFRTSSLAPFAANIEFRLYEQRASDSCPIGPAEYFVQVVVNEREDLMLNGCDHVRCPLATVKQLWWSFLYEYDFDAMCRMAGE